MSAEAKLKHLGIELPEPMNPAGSYVPAVRTGNLLYLSGAGPLDAEGHLTRAKLGENLSIEEGQAAARLVALQLLATIRRELGTLDRVKQVVKLLCMVNATPDFADPPKVANGASDLLVEIFGEAGKHARSAVGMATLPMGMAVEVEMIIEVTE